MGSPANSQRAAAMRVASGKIVSALRSSPKLYVICPALWASTYTKSTTAISATMRCGGLFHQDKRDNCQCGPLTSISYVEEVGQGVCRSAWLRAVDSVGRVSAKAISPLASSRSPISHPGAALSFLSPLLAVPVLPCTCNLYRCSCFHSQCPTAFR